ncbi:hypothetical protein MBLNU457_1599t1 [Dothideomycetes sp. NU457]
MSRAQVIQQYSRILTQWPVDRLRPGVQFQDVLKKRVETAPASKSAMQNITQIPSTHVTRSSEMQEINALSALLDNALSKRSPVPRAMMSPQSAPDHYNNLAREIEEAPDRSWFGNLRKKLSNMVRWQ